MIRRKQSASHFTKRYNVLQFAYIHFASMLFMLSSSLLLQLNYFNTNIPKRNRFLQLLIFPVYFFISFLWNVYFLFSANSSSYISLGSIAYCCICINVNALTIYFNFHIIFFLSKIASVFLLLPLLDYLLVVAKKTLFIFLCI